MYPHTHPHSSSDVEKTLTSFSAWNKQKTTNGQASDLSYSSSKASSSPTRFQNQILPPITPLSYRGKFTPDSSSATLDSARGSNIYNNKSNNSKSSRSSTMEDKNRDIILTQRQYMRRLPQIDQGRQQKLQGKQLCQQWMQSHREEEKSAQHVMDIARELFYEVIVRHHTLIADNGEDQLRLLAVRAAVSCFLLEEIVKALPRHNILAPCIAMLIRAIYVPDTAESRKMLSGTVEYPQLLDDIPLDSSSRLLLTRFARKTYFIAHHELTQKVITYAHANSSCLQHFHRLPRIFALLNSNWIKSFLRITLKAWHHVCQTRRQSEQKFRARWARRLAAERIRAGVRQWRVYANVRLQTAAAAESIRTRIQALNISTQTHENEIENLRKESSALSGALLAKENLRVALEKKIAETEREYKVKLEQVREMDRVGSRLLDALLLRTPFPTGTEIMSPLEVLIHWANATLVESPLGPLLVAASDEDFALYIDNMDSRRQLRLRVADISEEDLPFSCLLSESIIVSFPLHRLLALIRAMDFDSGTPTSAELKNICKTDAKLRALRAEIENDENNNAGPIGLGGIDDILHHQQQLQLQQHEIHNKNNAELLEMESIVGQSIVKAYQNITGSKCIVTAEQLMTRRRGIQLVFLAGLMRYFSNWLESKVKKQRSSDDSRGTSRQRKNENSNMDSPTQNQSPVMSAASIVGNSASKTSLNSSTERSKEGEEEEEEETLTIDRYLGVRDKQFTEWFHPPQNHISWITIVENQRRWIAASLSAMHQAVNVAVETPIVFSTEAQEEAPEFMENVTLSKLSDILPKEAITSSSFFLRLAQCVQKVFPKLRSLFLEYAQKDNDHNETLYVTALDFWRMLRDCRVVGGRGNLHRALVRRIITKVSEDNSNHNNNNNNTTRTTEVVKSLKNPKKAPPRSVREAAEIDLKSGHYKIRLNAAEFIEALLRCAKEWDSMQQLLPEKSTITIQEVTETNNEEEEKEKGELSEKTDSTIDERDEKYRQAIRYEVCEIPWSLRPSAVREFLHEHIITHGFRGPTLDPFRRATRHSKLRECFYINLDTLFAIFSHYARPKEAYGIRPLHSTYERSNSTRRSTMEHSTSYPTLTNISISNNNNNNNNNNNSTNNTGYYNDVGIARVLAYNAVQRMVMEFDWMRLRRLTWSVVEEAFNSVIIDVEREPNVMFFPEWLDLLCVMALYYDPNPTRPLYAKMPGFLKEYVLKYHRGED